MTYTSQWFALTRTSDPIRSLHIKTGWNGRTANVSVWEEGPEGRLKGIFYALCPDLIQYEFEKAWHSLWHVFIQDSVPSGFWKAADEWHCGVYSFAHWWGVEGQCLCDIINMHAASCYTGAFMTEKWRYLHFRRSFTCHPLWQRGWTRHGMTAHRVKPHRLILNAHELLKSTL